MCRSLLSTSQPSHAIAFAALGKKDDYLCADRKTKELRGKLTLLSSLVHWGRQLSSVRRSSSPGNEAVPALAPSNPDLISSHSPPAPFCSSHPGLSLSGTYKTSPLRGLCTCCSLCLECSPSEPLHGWLRLIFKFQPEATSSERLPLSDTGFPSCPHITALFGFS